MGGIEKEGVLGILGISQPLLLNCVILQATDPSAAYSFINCHTRRSSFKN
jgi:hypothetical protein